MKRILYLSPWAELGGAEAILLDLLQFQDRSRFEPRVVFFHSGSLVQRVNAMGIQTEIFEAPRFRNPFSFLRTVFQLKRLIQEQGISLLMCNGGWAQVLGGCAAWLAKTTCIWFQHGRPNNTDWIEKLNSFIPASRVLVNSKFTEKAQKEFGNKKTKVFLLYPGVDLKRLQFDPQARKKIRYELHISESAQLVLLPARFEHWKGQMVLLKAAVEVLSKKSDVYFVLSGGCLFGLGQQVDAELRKFVKENPVLESKVIFPGHRDDMPALYSAADVVVNTSIEPETFGMTVIEAGACERPVVASAHGGALETILHGENGFLVKPGDHLALAKALLDLCENLSLREKFGKASRVRIAEQFEVKNMVRRFEKCCDEV